MGADTESGGIEWTKYSPFCLSVSVEDQSFAIDLRDRQNLRWAKAELPKARVLAFHHARHDVQHLMNLGVKLDLNRVRCTMVQAALLNEHLMSYGLDDLGHSLLGEKKVEDIWEKLAELFGGRPTKKAQAPNMVRAPFAMVEPYAVQDAVLCRKLYEWQLRKIDEEEIGDVIALEHELMPVLIDMEREGVRVDVERAEEAVAEITKVVDAEYAAVVKAAGWEINVNSAPQMRKLFAPLRGPNGWEVKGISIPSTGAGAPSLGTESLLKLEPVLPLAGQVLRLRRLVKLRDVFLGGHVLGNQVNGFVHTQWNQTRNDTGHGTGTGRISSTGPALQQIPHRDKEANRIIRSCFLGDPGCEWLRADQSQFEVRIGAHYINDQRLLDAYEADPDLDFHQMTADLTGLPRKRTSTHKISAKEITLGRMFGMSDGRLAVEAGLPHTVDRSRGFDRVFPGEEAKRLIRQYDSAIPGVRSYLRRAGRVAEQRGHVWSYGRRKLRFPHGYGSHKAGGLIIQASAADMIKRSMIKVHKMLRGSNSRMVVTVHDELGISLNSNDRGLIPEIECALTEVEGLRVPLRCEVQAGENWFESDPNG